MSDYRKFKRSRGLNIINLLKNETSSGSSNMDLTLPSVVIAESTEDISSCEITDYYLHSENTELIPAESNNIVAQSLIILSAESPAGINNNAIENSGYVLPESTEITHDSATVLQNSDENAEEIIMLQVPDSSNLTKSGNIRKRKKKLLDPEMKKTRKQEEFAIQHRVLEPCDMNTCKFKCTNKIDSEHRFNINKQFWCMGWLQRRCFIFNSCQRLEIKRRTTHGPHLRNNTFKYFLNDKAGIKQFVCKTFFLTTLGYKKSNDRVVHDVLSKTPKEDIQPQADKRGKQSSYNKLNCDAEFNEHVESFRPTVSHYRREHAPNVRYLPSDITITAMHENFIEKYPNIAMAYDTYRQKLKHLNISFTKLGHEECSTCESIQIHPHKKDNLQSDCDICQNWVKHHDKYVKSRQLYNKHVETNKKLTKSGYFSVDLEKVIMLPRVDTFKEVIFTRRLIVYNECFVPLGEKSLSPAYAAIWHEGVSGRNKEDIISTFYSFLLSQRDAEQLHLWLDNCSSQNKNWCFLSFLVFIVNATEVSFKEIYINYFEPGHTYMSADSFHHQVELSLKKMGKVYDFNDFSLAVQQANKQKVIVKEMKYTDFYHWIDYSSAIKLKDPNRPLLADIVCLKARRGFKTLEYKVTYDEVEEFKTLNFIKSINMKNDIPFPTKKLKENGFPKEKKQNILHSLKNILPENRKRFWRDLPEPETEINDRDETQSKRQRRRKSKNN